jgi:hypothetical protein
MIKTIIKVSIIGGLLMTLLLRIPELFDPLASLIDDTFDINFVSMMNNVYSTFPSDILDLFTIFLGVLSIGVILSWLNGGKSH